MPVYLRVHHIRSVRCRPRFHADPSCKVVGPMSRCALLGLIVLRGQFVVYIPNERNPHLRRIVAAQDVADKVCLDLHLHHLQGAAKDPAVYVGEPQLVLRPSVVWQLDKVRQGVLVKDERELLAVVRPVGDLGGDV